MAWTTPITWSSGATVTASQMNTEVRDHVDFLKSALDLLTNSTTAESGTTTYIQVRRTGSTETVFEGQVGAEANPRIRILASGKIQWGAGGASALDTTLERASASVMALTGNTALRIENVLNSILLDLRVTNDSYGRVVGVIRTDGGGEWRIGDGVYAYLLRSYYDGTNYQGVIAQSDATNGPETLKIITRSGGTSSLTLSTSQSSSGDWMQFYQNTKELRWLSGSTLYGSLSAPASTYVQTGSTFGLWGQQGVRTFTRAGTVADGNFDFTPGDGHLAVDTLHDLLYARSGGSWSYADLAGSLACIGPFTWANLTNGTTDIDGSYGGFGTANMRPPIAAGEVTLDGANPTGPIATGLGVINAVTLTMKGSTSPGLDPYVLTYTTSGDDLNIYAWKATSSSNPTLIASTDTMTVSWMAVGSYASGTPRVRTGFAGDFIAIAARASQNFVAGSITIKGNIGGTTTTNLSVTLNSSASEAYDICDPGDQSFAATNQIGMTVTDVASLNPDFMDVIGHAFVLLRRV